MVSGPNAKVSWEGSITPWEMPNISQHAFPRSLKKAVLEHNLENNGNQYNSDASFDPNQALQKMNIYAEDAAEIDHIIPRVDSQGCLCGDPPPNNAAVISREMNAATSNTSPKWDANRAQMYAAWAAFARPRRSIARALTG